MREIKIDGSQGEGGGQILRTALSLSMMTGIPFVIENMRAGRSKPGLLRQHLACVNAAAEISSAIVEGAELQSKTLRFQPGPVRAGDYRFSIGSAGSCTLVLQTVLIPLASVGRSTVTVEGGTHNSMCPNFEFLHECYRPVLAECGIKADFVLERHGFYPAGGGLISVTIERDSGAQIAPLVCRTKQVNRVEVLALSSSIPERIGRAEVELAASELRIPLSQTEARMVESPGPGNLVLVRVVMTDGVAVFTSFGARGLPLERVARDAAQQAQHFAVSPARVEGHLQDQMLLPLATGAGGSFSTVEPTEHTKTNAEVIRLFLPVSIVMDEQGKDDWTIDVRRNEHADF